MLKSLPSISKVCRYKLFSTTVDFKFNSGREKVLIKKSFVSCPTNEASSSFKLLLFSFPGETAKTKAIINKTNKTKEVICQK